MATLSSQEVGLSSMTPSYAAAGASDKFTPSDRTFLHFKNTNAAARTVTIVSTSTKRGLAVADVTVPLDATTGDEMVGPFPYEDFANSADGLADIQYSASAGVTVAVLRLAQLPG